MSRIAFVLPSMDGGGAERVALTLIKTFIEKGHEVDLVLMQATGELMPLVPTAVTIVELKALRIRQALLPLIRYLRERCPTAIQVSMWPLTSVTVLARAISRISSRLVLSDHAALSKQYATYGLLHRQFLKWSIRLTYPHADARVVVAAETGNDLSQLSGLRRESFEVVYNPVESPAAHWDPIADSDLWGGDGIRILNVGRLAPQKNQKLLIEAFARLNREKSARLLIIGEGPLRLELEEHAEHFGVSGRVKLPGFSLDPARFYRSADLFVLSSDFEGYPVVLIEAMHCGLPIVSTNCTSGPFEILEGGKFGKLAPCGDSVRLAQAMSQALDSPVDPRTLRARAFQLSANAVEQYLALLTVR